MARPETRQFHEQQVAGRDMALQREGMEQGRLIDPPLAHHRDVSSLVAREKQPRKPEAIADFFYGIGTNRHSGVECNDGCEILAKSYSRTQYFDPTVVRCGVFAVRSSDLELRNPNVVEAGRLDVVGREPVPKSPPACRSSSGRKLTARPFARCKVQRDALASESPRRRQAEELHATDDG